MAYCNHNPLSVMVRDMYPITPTKLVLLILAAVAAVLLVVGIKIYRNDRFA